MYLLLLRENKTVVLSEWVYTLYASGCDSHSRSLLRQPLTADERSLIVDMQGPQYLDQRLRSLCAMAKQLTTMFEARTASLKGNVIETLEQASQLCGFTWCNPQYCH